MKFILWFISLMFVTWSIFNIIGFSGLTTMFPEGRRWWHLPLQVLTLAIFALVILYHPF